MRNQFLILLTSLLLASACSSGVSHTLTLSFEGMKSDTVSVEFYQIGARRAMGDTLLVADEKGVFTLDVNNTEPLMLNVLPISGLLDTKLIRGTVRREAMSLDLFVPVGDKSCVTGESVGDNTILYSVKGSPENEFLASLRNTYIKAYRYRDMEDEYFRDGKTKEQRDSVYRLGEGLMADMMAKKIEYIYANPNSDLSGKFLSEVSNSEFVKAYPTINEEVKAGAFAKPLASKKRTSDLLANAKVMVEGAMAPDFLLSGVGDEEVRLSDLRGKYVFLYFWGSW